MVEGSGGRLPDKGPSMLGEGSGVKAKGLETWQRPREPEAAAGAGPGGGPGGRTAPSLGSLLPKGPEGATGSLAVSGSSVLTLPYPPGQDGKGLGWTGQWLGAEGVVQIDDLAAKTGQDTRLVLALGGVGQFPPKTGSLLQPRIQRPDPLSMCSPTSIESPPDLGRKLSSSVACRQGWAPLGHPGTGSPTPAWLITLA